VCSLHVKSQTRLFRTMLLIYALRKCLEMTTCCSYVHTYKMTEVRKYLSSRSLHLDGTTCAFMTLIFLLVRWNNLYNRIRAINGLTLNKPLRYDQTMKKIVNKYKKLCGNFHRWVVVRYINLHFKSFLDFFDDWSLLWHGASSHIYFCHKEKDQQRGQSTNI